MSRQTTGILPAIYRFTFLWFEPLSCLSGFYSSMFDPDMFLRSYVPGAVRNPAHDIIHSYVGGAMICFAILQRVLLRYTDDVNIWKMLNVGMIAWEACILSGCYTTLASQGRLDICTWRAEDCMSVGLPVVIGLVRVLFVAGIGLGEGAAATSRRGGRAVLGRTD